MNTYRTLHTPDNLYSMKLNTKKYGNSNSYINKFKSVKKGMRSPGI